MKKLESGVLKCKSWGIEPFWVVFGNVVEPKFMTNDNHRLYRDKSGLGYMLLPLLKLHLPGHFDDILTRAWNLGLREHPAYFGLMVYKMNYMVVKDTAKSIAEFYTEDELIERIAITINCNTWARVNKAYVRYNSTNTSLVSDIFNSPELNLSISHKGFQFLTWALHFKLNTDVLQQKTIDKINKAI